MFGEHIPTLNLKGEEKIKSTFGGVLSFVIVCCVAFYAVIKANDVYERNNPIVNILTLPGGLDTEEGSINVRESNFRMAFALEANSGKYLLDD